MPIYKPNKVPPQEVRLTCPHCGAVVVSTHKDPNMARHYAIQEMGEHITQKHQESLN